MSVARLPSSQGPLLGPLCEELAGKFSERAAFEAWRGGLLAAVEAGELKVLARWDGEHPASALLYQEGHGLATVLAWLGPDPGDEGLCAAIATLQSTHLALVWNESCGPDWPHRLRALGARPYALQTFVQDLTRVPFRALAETGVAIGPWQSSDKEAVIRLVVEANCAMLPGLFLALPDAPRPKQLDASLRRLLDGDSGDWLRWASRIARMDGLVVGAVLAIRRDERPFLYELATHASVRGRHVGLHLVQALQHALLAAGEREMGFITTDTNTPVHRMFTPDEIMASEESRGGYWLAPPERFT